MAYKDTLLTEEHDDVLMMTPKEGADYDDEGSGSTSGYGDVTGDDFEDDDIAVDGVDDPLDLEDDPLLDDDIDDDDL